MRHSNQGRFQQQVQLLRRQFLQDGDLPFTNVLSEDLVTRALTAIKVFWKDRIYSPLVTLWVFLGQVQGDEPSRMCRLMILEGFGDQSHQITHRQIHLHLVFLETGEIQQIIDQPLLEPDGVLTAPQHAQHVFQGSLLLFVLRRCLA